MALRALTKRDQDGHPYVRQPAIEQAILVALEQDLQTLSTRAWVTKDSASTFLPLECLVHLIRDACRRGDENTTTALLPALLSRCESILQKAIPDRRLDRADETRENVLSDFSELFAVDGDGSNPDELDFYECRFLRAFKMFYIDHLRIGKRDHSHLTSLADQSDSKGDDQEGKRKRVPDTLLVRPAQIDDLQYKELLKAIERLPSKERDAIMLCHVFGFKEESEDPSMITAATQLGVTGRTVRNRLERAKTKLSEFREGL